MGLRFWKNKNGQLLPESMGGYAIELAKATTLGKSRETTDAQPEGQLTLDVCQTTDDIIIESAIAGVKPENIDISVTDDSVSIKGDRSRERSENDREYLFQECYWGRFARSIILPETVDPDNAEVTFKNGLLTIKLPKANRKKIRKLKVRID